MILDTNVLVYAVGSEHPLREPCRALIAAIRDGAVVATTSVLVLQEFTYVYARRRPLPDAVNLARGYAELLSPLLAVETHHLTVALRLIEKHSIRPSDALLAATAIETAAVLVTADGDLARLPELSCILPDSVGVEGILTNA